MSGNCDGLSWCSAPPPMNEHSAMSGSQWTHRLFWTAVVVALQKSPSPFAFSLPPTPQRSEKQVAFWTNGRRRGGGGGEKTVAFPFLSPSSFLHQRLPSSSSSLCPPLFPYLAPARVQSPSFPWRRRLPCPAAAWNKVGKRRRRTRRCLLFSHLYPPPPPPSRCGTEPRIRSQPLLYSSALYRHRGEEETQRPPKKGGGRKGKKARNVVLKQIGKAVGGSVGQEGARRQSQEG